VSEILTTLLMNYVALALLEFALTRSWLLGQQGSIIPIGPPIPPDRHLPLLWPPTRLHLGFVLALALTVGVGLFFRSPQGFRVDLLGANPRLAAQAGIPIRRTLGALLLVSGAFSGLAGAVQLMGTEFTLSLAITGGLGFSGLLVAVLGGGRAPLTAVAALAFAALATGAGGAQNLGVPQSLVTVIQGLVLLAVFLRRRRAR
jgi:simple sugar transport system permease protein